jgi:uncharacterized protein
VSPGPPDPAPRSADLDRLARDVGEWLHSELPPVLHYHDAAHTLDDVVPAVLVLARAEGIGGDELVVLHAAALLHDIGYTRTSQDHEIVGAALAAEILPGYGFSAEQVAGVAQLILATRIGHRPTSLSEAVLADADLDVLRRTDFWCRHRALQRELAELGQVHDDVSWARIQQRFLREHRYHTTTARERGRDGKRANERRVAARLRRLIRLAAAGRLRARPTTPGSVAS